MAIEPLKHLTLLVPRSSVGDVVDWLQGLSSVHVADAARLVEGGDDDEAGFEKPAASTEDIDNRISQVSHALEIFSTFGDSKGSLVEMIVSLPKRVSLEQRREVLENFDYLPVYEEAVGLEKQYNDLISAVERAREEYSRLEFFRLLPFEPEDIRALKRCRVWIGSMTADNWDALRAEDEAATLSASAELRRGKRTVDLCIVALEEDAAEAASLLRSHGLEEWPVPSYEGTRTERMDFLHGEIMRCHTEAERCRGEIKKLCADAGKFEILLGCWEAERACAAAQNSAINSRRIAVLTGFIRARDERDFRRKLQRDFPRASSVLREPQPEDDVPVEITNSRFFQPLSFLVDLFGRPGYFDFDPTPYLAISFLIFFGMCFGDVVYGLALTTIGYLLARKARPYEGLHKLCMLFCYAGIFTTVIGFMMGSWASDLPAYLGEENLIYRIQQRTTLIDPIERALLLLLIAIGIGVLNQFYGIGLKAYALVRKGRALDAVFDAGLWFVVLPGFLVVFGRLFFDMPAWLLRLGVVMLVAGGIGLVLTQGREAEGLAAKFGAGLISIYGILGTYGCVSFLSDILSYSRLMALGLTTAIVGMAFNIIADLVRGAPVAGVALFVVVLVLGHTFNFMVSMLAAFVHPARLIFLEFFNRFYEPGGSRFTPLSLSTDSMIVET